MSHKLGCFHQLFFMRLLFRRCQFAQSRHLVTLPPRKRIKKRTDMSTSCHVSEKIKRYCFCLVDTFVLIDKLFCSASQSDDHSRVHLLPLEGVPDSDFINASFINVCIIIYQTNILCFCMWLLLTLFFLTYFSRVTKRRINSSQLKVLFVLVLVEEQSLLPSLENRKVNTHLGGLLLLSPRAEGGNC